MMMRSLQRPALALNSQLEENDIFLLENVQVEAVPENNTNAVDEYAKNLNYVNTLASKVLDSKANEARPQGSLMLKDLIYGND